MKTVCLILTFTTLLKCYQSDEDVSTIDVQPEDDNNLQQVGAEYLQNVMNQLEKDRLEGQPVDIMELPHMFNTERVSDSFPEKGKDNTMPPNFAISGPTPIPSTVEAEVYSADPPPSLTSHELNAIYEAAITKGSTLPQLQGSGTKPISSFHHPPPPPPSSQSQIVKPAAQGPAGDSLPGYYYYFYPIKSFTKAPEKTSSTPPPVTQPIPVHVTMMQPPNKGMEPLFMAISGFIGMALMFVFSVLFLPKFGKFRGTEDFSKLKEAPEEFGAFMKVFVETMDGKDCSERLACEVGRILRGMKMDNKPLKILEIVLPPRYAKQITQVRKAAAKKEKCNFIPCKFKTSRPQPPLQPKNKKPWKNSQKAHELWMKNFQKGKISFKQPENIWKNNGSDNR